MPDPEAYLLGTSRAEQDHRLGQGTLFEAETHWLLDRISLSIGGWAVNLSCGPLGILPLLSEHVGPTETVVGIEREAHLLAQARAAVDQRGLQYGQVLQGEATAAPLPHATFDLVHERLLLLVHERLLLMVTPHKTAVLTEMVALTVPGGVMEVQDCDVVSLVCEPPHPAWLVLLTTYSVFH